MGVGRGSVRRNPYRIVVSRRALQGLGWTHEASTTVVANSGGGTSVTHTTRIWTSTTLVCGRGCGIFSLLPGRSRGDYWIIVHEVLEALSVMSGEKLRHGLSASHKF